MKIVNTQNSEHYKWGEGSSLAKGSQVAKGSDGWHLLKSDSLSVIEEKLPPGEKELRHYHNHSQQFFYVLSGIAEIEISGSIFEVHSGSGIHVPAQAPHQLKNNGAESLRFLVISEPKSHGDRVSV